MPSMGGPELIIILLLALVVFGAGKLPEVGSALGKGIREFRAATTDPLGIRKAATSDPDPPSPPPTERCAACGHEQAADDRFCGGCGAALSGPT